jgi:hypothetical protein
MSLPVLARQDAVFSRSTCVFSQFLRLPLRVKRRSTQKTRFGSEITGYVQASIVAVVNNPGSVQLSTNLTDRSANPSYRTAIAP